jgi:beta-N-acetylhexosaminidase
LTSVVVRVCTYVLAAHLADLGTNSMAELAPSSSTHSQPGPPNAAVAAAQNNDLLVVSTNNAYAINASTGQPTAAAAAQTQLARVLFGEVNPTGRLPVSIPRADGTGELFPFGHGLGY